MTPLVLVALGAVSAVPALASPNAVLSDCNTNGALTHTYSRADLQNALNTMPADVREYTNCYDVISRALLASAGGGSHGGGSSGSGAGAGAGGSAGAGVPPGATAKPGSAASNAAHTHKAVKHHGTPGANPAAGTVAPASGNAQPAANGINASSGSSSLPTPLIVVLALLALAALSGGGLAIHRRLVMRDGT